MSKAKKRPTYCWDTSVFLAWIKAEAGAPLDDIQLVAKEIDADRANLIVPVTIYTEVVGTKQTKRQLKQFDLFLKRSNVQVIDTTIAIAQKAADIRGKALRQKRSIKTPDATVIATAIIYGADVLHSLDERMIKLSGGQVVDGLEITSPVLLSGQKALPGWSQGDDATEEDA
jgi:predicted nucleic acid-binding protein